MTWVAFQGALELGFIYALVSLGLFISYRVLDLPDLTVDGSFTLGCATSAIFTSMQLPVVGLLCATAAGMLAGCVTAFLHTKLKIQPILSGIITMIALYSVNLRVMGNKSNLAILGKPTIFTYLQGVFSESLVKLVVPAIFAVLIAVALIFFFKSQLGLALRATGDNEEMVRSSSINTDRMKFLGLALANGIVALSGGLLAQYQGFSSIDLGTGMVVLGLAALIIGETLLSRRNLPLNIFAVVVGSVVYRIIIAFVLQMNISTNDLKLISAVIVTLAISKPAIAGRIQLAKLKKRGKQDAYHPSSEQDLS